MGLRAGLNVCGKSLPHGDSIPGPSSPTKSLYPLSYPGPVLMVSWLIGYRASFLLLLARVQYNDQVVCQAALIRCSIPGGGENFSSQSHPDRL